MKSRMRRYAAGGYVSDQDARDAMDDDLHNSAVGLTTGRAVPPSKTMGKNVKNPRLARVLREFDSDRAAQSARENEQPSSFKRMTNPEDRASYRGFAKGGGVKKGGKDNVTIKAQTGEFVVKKSSATKYGPKKMAAVNKGSAKIVTKGKRR